MKKLIKLSFKIKSKKPKSKKYHYQVKSSNKFINQNSMTFLMFMMVMKKNGFNTLLMSPKLTL